MHRSIGILEKFAETRYGTMWDVNYNTGSEFELQSSSVVKLGFLRVAFFPTYMILEQ